MPGPKRQLVGPTGAPLLARRPHEYVCFWTAVALVEAPGQETQHRHLNGVDAVTTPPLEYVRPEVVEHAFLSRIGANVTREPLPHTAGFTLYYTIYETTDCPETALGLLDAALVKTGQTRLKAIAPPGLAGGTPDVSN